MKIEVYSDGSGNIKGKPGGWAWVLVVNGTKHSEGSGHLESASNNDAELEGAIQGLAAVLKYKSSLREDYFSSGRKTPIEVTLVSDSEITLNWASGTYRFKQKDKMHKYEQLRALVRRMDVKFRWVKGHSGDHYNERCDVLANKARKGNKEKPKKEVKKSIKEPKQFRWNDKQLINILKNHLNPNHPRNEWETIDSLIKVVIELVELEEKRKK